MLLAINVSAQSDSLKRKSIFFEVLGSGGLGSFNYEKEFCRKTSTEYAWRIGVSSMPIDKNNGIAIILPVMAAANIGKNAHKLELGLGQGITFTTKGSFFIRGTAVVGYRYQPDHKKWFYRISYTPLISYIFDFQIQQWGGVSIGYTLGKKQP